MYHAMFVIVVQQHVKVFEAVVLSVLCVVRSGRQDHAGSPDCNTSCSLVRGECVSFWHQGSRATAA